MGSDGDPSLLAKIASRAEAQAVKVSKILVIDDDAPLRRSIPRLLATDYRSFDEAASLEEAIALLEQNHYDLILLDYHLPDGSGLALLDWRAEMKRSDAVIILSGEDGIDAAIGALRRGAEDFLRKPYHLAQLQRSVDNTLQKGHLLRANLQISQRLKESERLHRYLVQSSPDFIFMLNAMGDFTYVNPRATTLLGYQREELAGRSLATITSEEDRQKVMNLFANPELPPRTPQSLELKLRRNPVARNGGAAELSFSLHTEPMLGRGSGTDASRFLGTYGVARDVTDRKRAEEIIVFQAYHDQLTRLPNRLLFHDRLELALAQVQRRQCMLAVLFIDLDRFKLVNDTYGHGEGDQLLRGVASRIRQSLRKGDTLARLGGDEFVALLPDLTSSEDAERIAQKVLETLRPPFHLKHGDFRVTVSIGISMYPRDGEVADILVQHADIAMYQVKRGGKNGFCFFDPSLNADYRQRVSLENDLRVALERDEFELQYQPQVSLSQMRVVGTEALLRWRHPDHGLLNPASFISVAEEIGLIGGISNWVIDRASAQLAQWHQRGHDDMRMSINLSPRDFEHGEIVDTIDRNLQRHLIPPKTLELEITESLMMRDTGATADKIGRLRELGVGVAIDDFGTGYSALGYLQRFQVSSLKIDRSFVRELNGEGNPIINAITGIARGFGLHVVAEGVETGDQIAHLRALGCDSMQGFYFSHPVEAEEAERLFVGMPPALFN